MLEDRNLDTFVDAWNDLEIMFVSQQMSEAIVDHRETAAVFLKVPQCFDDWISQLDHRPCFRPKVDLPALL
jgi:hypothetical protein